VGARGEGDGGDEGERDGSDALADGVLVVYAHRGQRGVNGRQVLPRSRRPERLRRLEFLRIRISDF
jgi:hypothetical protein